MIYFMEQSNYLEASSLSAGQQTPLFIIVSTQATFKQSLTDIHTLASYWNNLAAKLHVIHLRAYAQYSKRDPTYAQCYCLFINLCLLVPQHVSANNTP
jgi:hypothetical protein